MEYQDIICFAKDRNEDPTSCNHVMEGLARNHRVVWLNSIAMRAPSVSSGKDWSKIWRKIGRFLHGAVQVDTNLWVFTPLVLPFPHSKLAAALNRWILRATIRGIRWRLGIRSFQLWTFVPNSVEYVGHLGESLVVYYCTDDWSGFSYIDSEKMVAHERELLKKADICFCTANLLVESKKPLNPNTHLASHGVEHAHFAKALLPETVVPEDVANLPQPRLAFFGGIHEWFDFPLVKKLATAHPEWAIILMGKIEVDASSVADLPNVHILGRRPYDSLPAYCKGFDVGLIPFLVNDMTRNVNPIKLREYLSAGLPVVSTDLPEMTYYTESVCVAQTHDEFIRGVEKAVEDDSPARRRERSQSMLTETWEAKIAELERIVDETRERKSED